MSKLMDESIGVSMMVLLVMSGILAIALVWARHRPEPKKSRYKRGQP